MGIMPRDFLERECYLLRRRFIQRGLNREARMEILSYYPVYEAKMTTDNVAEFFVPQAEKDAHSKPFAKLNGK